MTTLKQTQKRSSGAKPLLPVFAVLMAFSTPVIAQDGANLDQVQRKIDSAGEVNNGTNPTLLATKLTHQYEYTDLGSGFYVGLLENIYTIPFGDSNQFAIEVNVPFASGPIDNTLDLSDVSLKWLHVPYVTAKNGAAYTLEFFSILLSGLIQGVVKIG